jgi:hypothetical protein
MSTAIWYHGMGIRDRGWHHIRTGFRGKIMVVRIGLDPSYLACPCCGSRSVIRQGQVEKRRIAAQLNFSRMIVSFALQRVKCRIWGAATSNQRLCGP